MEGGEPMGTIARDRLVVKNGRAFTHRVKGG